MESDLAGSVEDLVREYNEIMLKISGKPLRSIDVYDGVLLAQLAAQPVFGGAMNSTGLFPDWGVS